MQTAALDWRPVSPTFALWAVKMLGLAAGTIVTAALTVLATGAEQSTAIVVAVVGFPTVAGFLWKLLLDHRSIERERATLNAVIADHVTERDRLLTMLEAARIETVQLRDQLAEVRTNLAVMALRAEGLGPP